MEDGPAIIALIPAYKEELTISMVVTLSLKHVDKVIVVDDGSPDRTSVLAKAAGAEVIRQDPNQGKAAALSIGLKRCAELNPKCVILLDGDGQMDPDQIPIVAAPVLKGEADLVIGSRFIGSESNVPKHRILGQRILNSATNMSTHVKITDSQSGFRALSVDAIKNMNFASSSYNVESDMIVHFSDIKLKITEVPISVRYDVPNAHKQKPFRHGLQVLNRIVTIIGYKKPIYIFGIPGLMAFLLGLLLSASTFMETIIIFNWSLTSQGIAGVAAFGIGLFLIFAALVLNSLGLMMDNLSATIKRQ